MSFSSRGARALATRTPQTRRGARPRQQPASLSRKAALLANTTRASRGHCEGVLSHTTKLISRRRLSSQVRRSPRNKHNERSHEAMATFRLNATGRPHQRTRQECREGVVSITTNDETHRATTIIVAMASLPQLLCVETNRRPFLDRKPRAD
jgi:hypothetical protein